MSEGTGHILFLTALAVLFAVTFLLAQVGRRSGRCGGVREFLDGTAIEVSITGTVEEVELVSAPQGSVGRPPPPMCGICPLEQTGTHISLKTVDGTMVVHVGPAAYLESQNFSLTQGDEVTVTGSKVHQGANFLIAGEIKKGDRVLELRDANGFPLWWGLGSGRPPSSLAA